MNAKCTYYNKDGDISVFIEKVPYNTNVFFRKYSNNKIELTICRMLKYTPLQNVVKIYNVSENIIDMEMLNIKKNKKYSIDDVKNGLKNLNNIDIIYIDMKYDNVGYSHIDKEFKIFDFDMSGIVYKYNKKKWLLEPHNSLILKDIKKIHNIKNLYSIDKYSFEHYCNSLKKYYDIDAKTKECKSFIRIFFSGFNHILEYSKNYLIVINKKFTPLKI